MMNDKQIKKILNDKTNGFQITPIDIKTQIQPSSIDLTLDKYVTTPPEGTIDTKQKQKQTNIEITNKIIIEPDEFLLLQTEQTITLPDNIAAICTGRSSIGRLGLTVHITANYIDPGFKGKLTLEVKNNSKNTIILYPQMRICQLLLFQIEPSEKPYNGKYQLQEYPTQSKIHQDFQTHINKTDYTTINHIQGTDFPQDTQKITVTLPDNTKAIYTRTEGDTITLQKGQNDIHYPPYMSINSNFMLTEHRWYYPEIAGCLEFEKVEVTIPIRKPYQYEQLLNRINQKTKGISSGIVHAITKDLAKLWQSNDNLLDSTLPLANNDLSKSNEEADRIIMIYYGLPLPETEPEDYQELIQKMEGLI